MFSNLFLHQDLAQADAERIAYELSLGIDAHALVTIADANGLITYANPNFLQATGYTADEVLGKTHALLNSGYHDDTFFKAMYQTLNQGLVYQGIFHNRNKSGDGLWLDTTIKPLLDESGRLYRFVSIRRDITPLLVSQQTTQRTLDELAIVNNQLQHALVERDAMQKQLLQANKSAAIGQLTAGIAHDFNNLLAILMGYRDLIEMELPANTAPDITHYLTTMNSACLRGKDLVAKLMAYCRRNNTPEPHQLPVIEPVAVLDEALRMLRPSVSSSVKFITHLVAARPNNHCHIALRPGDLQQIITNLVLNARDAIDQHGTVTLSVEPLVELGASHCSDCHQTLARPEGSNWVAISVADNGCGMEPEQLNLIFDPFYTTKPVGQGTGLGLSVISGIVHEAGGHITVESSPGAGTVFTVLVPQALAPNAKIQPASSQAPAPSASRRLLIVDDEAMVLAMIEAKLKHAGHTITACLDPHQALATYTATPDAFDAVITDYQMPTMDGLTLAHTLRQHSPNLLLMICSGSPINPDRLPANTRKFDKPLDFKALLAHIAGE